ncbi:MAG: type II secretion system protein GspK [Candidatus Omnitrophica bacterium]|nr:type II secretion system protein GspK [Candidatus Omnitrophota bacterium]
MKKCSGSVLIIVLWSLFMLSALAAAISGYVNSRISLAGKLSERAIGYYMAKAGLERAIAEVKILPVKKYDMTLDPWASNDEIFKDVKLGSGSYSVIGLRDLPAAAAEDGKVEYGMSDEESKININKAPQDVLKNLLEIVGGIDSEESGKIAYSIINWRSPADRANKEGSGSFRYQSLDRPYNCKNAPMETIEELLLVDGITPEIFARIKSRITIYTNGAVNINTADEMVLRALGMSEELAKKIASLHGAAVVQNGDPEETLFFTDIASIPDAVMKKISISSEEKGKINSLSGAGLLSVKSDNFSGIVIGRSFAGQSLTGGAKIAFVFDRNANVIKYWSENVF